MLMRATLLFSLALAFILVSCAPEHSDIVLATYGNNKIKMKEFENVYAKNAGGIEQAKKIVYQK